MLSQTAEYALRAMSCLAYSPDRLVPTPELASMTQVPPNYLAKVLQSLSQANLIAGRRGVGGGYKLSRQADEISLLDVVRAIDPVERIASCPLGLQNHGPNLCPLHRAVDKAIKMLIDEFQGVTLHDVVSGADASKPLCDSEMTARFRLPVSPGQPGGD